MQLVSKFLVATSLACSLERTGGQPTQCSAMRYTTSSCVDSHPYLCEGANEKHGICMSSTSGSCCCTNSAGTLSSGCYTTGKHNLCCNGHCLDPDEWECCGESKCLKSTHSCMEGTCVQHRKLEVDIPTLSLGSLLLIACCLTAVCVQKATAFSRCIFTFVGIGFFMCVLGLATWDLTGPVKLRPLVMASFVILPLGIAGLCVLCMQKDSVQKQGLGFCSVTWHH